MGDQSDDLLAALKPIERKLVDCVERGETLDLAGDQSVRARVVRDILRGRLAPNPDPHGVQLRGVRIDGRLDLDNVTSAVWLRLDDCQLDEGLSAMNANLAGLVLSMCHLEHPQLAALNAHRLNATLLDLRRTTVTANSPDGAINLSGGAHLACLECSGASVRNESGPALYADGLRVDQEVFLRKDADSNEQFVAVGTGELGAVRLLGAHLGILDCAGASVRNESGPALYADGLCVDQDVFLTGGFEAVGAGELGAVRLLGAQLGGLDCDGASVRNESGPALYADWLRVDQIVFLTGGFEAVGAGELGAVRLLDAQLGGLDCDGASVRNESGPALHADRIRVDQDVFLRRDSKSNIPFEAVGAGELGAVRLLGARLGGLECDGASVRNESGPALNADGLRVDQDVFLRRDDKSNIPFEAVGAGELGAVRLLGARLGELDCSGATVHNKTGPALMARRLQVDQKLFLDDIDAFGAGKHAVVELVDVRVGGVLSFKPAQLKHHTNPHSLINVDGLVYTGLAQGTPTSEWLRLLRDGTRDYAAQPYQHLAAAHRAAGHDSEARRILMAQRRHQIDRHALTGRAERAWARFTGLTLGYGYQPWRALIGLLAVIGTAVTVAVIVGGHGGLTRVGTSLPCTVIERIGAGLDLGTPLIGTGTRTRCAATNTTAGQALTLIGWVLRLLAWACATLFIAGFTGAVRKT